jgi:hypothetical protein
MPTAVRPPLLRAAAAIIIVSAIGCGGDPPDKEIRQARAAIEAARGAGADQYAKAEYGAAQDALKRSLDAVADRDYRLALNHALDARERAEAAAKQAVDGKVIARADADRAVRDLTAALSDARLRLKSAEAAHVPPRIVNEARRAIADADTAVQKARTTIEAGDYQAATTLIGDTSARLRAATHDLEIAQSSPARRRH